MRFLTYQNVRNIVLKYKLETDEYVGKKYRDNIGTEYVR